MAPTIDLRSDTVTHPTAAMREAMMRAELGDDVLGDDPTVMQLEIQTAQLLGKEAACFVPSGTMANQTAIRALTEPGDELVAHRDSHIIHYETGAPAALAGVMIHPLDGRGGLFEPRDVDGAIRPSEPHFARTRLLVIENTHNRGGGTVWPLERFAAVAAAARRHGLSVHLDGARLLNACVKLMCRPTEFTEHVDTVSICFSKGLGAPAGSAVAGTAETVARIRRFRKMFGGAMRQSGILAAACIHALDHHVERLDEDHANARHLAEAIASLPGIHLDLATVETNMVFFELEPRLGTAEQFCQRLATRGVRMIPMGPRRVRAVTHLDVDRPAIDRAIGVLRALEAPTGEGVKARS